MLCCAKTPQLLNEQIIHVAQLVPMAWILIMQIDNIFYLKLDTCVRQVNNRKGWHTPGGLLWERVLAKCVQASGKPPKSAGASSRAAATAGSEAHGGRFGGRKFLYNRLPWKQQWPPVFRCSPRQPLWKGTREADTRNSLPSLRARARAPRWPGGTGAPRSHPLSSASSRRQGAKE